MDLKLQILSIGKLVKAFVQLVPVLVPVAFTFTYTVEEYNEVENKTTTKEVKIFFICKDLDCYSNSVLWSPFRPARLFVCLVVVAELPVGL